MSAHKNLDVLQDGSENIHYRAPAIPLYIVMGDLRRFPNMTALCHWHEDVELLLPIKGYLSYNINGQIIHIAEGNAIFVNSRQMHYGFSTDGTDCEYICVTFKPDLLAANEEIRKLFLLPVLTTPSFPHLLLEQENPVHVPLLTLIRDLFAIREQTMAALGKLYEFWQGLYQLAEFRQTVPSNENISALKQMLEYIHLHYQEKITLHTLANAGGVCRTKCCQLFKLYTNATPNNYLTSYRLSQSMELLLSSDLSVIEISYACGFHSPSYFAETFKKYKGCTPTEFRGNASHRSVLSKKRLLLCALPKIRLWETSQNRSLSLCHMAYTSTNSYSLVPYPSSAAASMVCTPLRLSIRSNKCGLPGSVDA